MQVAGGSASYGATPFFSRNDNAPRNDAKRSELAAHLESQLKKQPGGALLYGGVTLGLLASAALSVYLWKQRERALNLLQTTPFERAEELISSCEHKIEDIERAIEELKQASR